MKRFISLSIALSVLVICSQAQDPIHPSPHDLVFKSLAPSWDEGIPLGNGMIGALIWEKEGKLRISLDRADLWDLRPLGNVYNEEYNFDWVIEQWKNNNYKKVQDAFDRPYDESAGPSKIPAAALEIPLEGFGAVESVRLFTHHGICRIKWENGSTMELFIDPEEALGWFRIDGVNTEQKLALVPPSYTLESDSPSSNKVTGGADLRRLGYPAGVLKNGNDTLDYTQEGWNGFNYQVSCQLERDTGSITGCWSISSHYPDQEDKIRASELVKQTEKRAYDQSRERLLTWWQQYWSQSAISLPDSLLEKQYFLEMYKFGAAARKGAPPISLQAVWTADNGKLPPWKGDFHHDLNTQLSYWPAYAGNHLELEEGFLDWLWNIRDEGKKYTKWYFGTDGLNIPGVTTLTGVPMGGWIQYSFGPTVSAWLGQHFYLHWKYSQDLNFLKDRAYPWIKEVAIFLDQIAVKDPAGKRKLPISSSPEIFDNSPKAWFSETTNYDLALIRFTYTAAHELANELGLLEEAVQWKKILSQWPQLTVDPETGLMFSPGFPYDESHRHFSHLMGFHPLGLVDISMGSEEREIINATLRNLEKHGPDYWTGYSYSWLANLYARAGEGENAAAALRDFATCFTLPSSFHVNGDQSGTGKSKFTYRPFTLEGNFAFASGVHEMLLQSHSGVVRIFPAIPDAWEDVSFNKLRCEGAFLVSAGLEQGEITRVEITAEKGGILKLLDPFEKGTEEKVLLFEMKKGESIELPLSTRALVTGNLPDESQTFTVEGISFPVISLNGTWKFTMNPSEKHWDNQLDFGDWEDILVPGECQMQGKAIRHDQPYVYKRSFEVPEDFEGKEIFLDFHGVYSYARVWVNGHFIREHHGGFTRWSCPITEFVKAGESAILTVEITDRTDDISYGSGYAKHQIGGILRDVKLRALPQQHFKQFYIETDLDEDYQDAELKISYELQEKSPASLQIELLDDKGEKINELEKKLESSKGIISIPVHRPKKWDAEHPNLYTLVATLLENGEETVTQREKIGFREVKVDGNRLLVNGRPVKLRGACRHDIHPTLGRMTTPAYDLKDVLLAKEANMNFIRTSHYPPSEAFLAYCDLYGIYVEDETAVCFVGSHRTDAYRPSGATENDSDFTGRYMSQLEEMVHHHRNHPSVIIWSIGNENRFGDNFIQSFAWVKENDPSRPVIYSYPGQVPDTLVNYEILSMHYPTWQGDLDQYNMVTKGFEYEEMPALFDEWAHVACYNNFEIKEDPNVRNFWSQSLDSMWAYTFEADGGLGGAIWCMLDETFMLPKDLPGFNQWWGILDENVIPATYMGPCVGYGEWGIVDTWRRKKPEFWGTKKAYSPARVLVQQIDGIKPESSLSIPVHNRFDHTNFSELKITWSYASQSGILHAVDLEPHQKGTLLIPANDWKEGTKLHLEFYQNDTMLVDQYSLLLGNSKISLPSCKPGELIAEEEEDKITLTGEDFRMVLKRNTGLMEDVIIDGDTIIKSGPYLNLKVPGEAVQYSTLVMDDLAKNWTCNKFSFSMEKGIATIVTQGKYDDVEASFNIRVDGYGIIEIAYNTHHKVRKQTIQEAGIKFITGNSFEKVSWNRDSYFTAYPETHPGRAFGEADLSHRPEMFYRQEPGHGWEQDARNFYYFGLEEELPYTNDVRSLKENIFEYSLATGSNKGLMVLSDGKQACRFDQIEDNNTLIINDQWDYNSLKWGNYAKQLPLEKSLNGKVVIAITEE